METITLTEKRQVCPSDPTTEDTKRNALQYEWQVLRFALLFLENEPHCGAEYSLRTLCKWKTSWGQALNRH